MKLLKLEEPTACDWCNAVPDEQHASDCPERDEEPDFPATCGRCGVQYITCCACDEERDR